MIASSKISTNAKGFTLIELLIVCPILMAVIAILMNYMFNQYGQLLVQNTKTNLQVQAQTIASGMQDDLANAGAYVSQLDSNLSDSFALNGEWNADTNDNQLIIATPALTAQAKSDNSDKVYINTLGCAPESTKQQNDVALNNIIYFSEGKNLFKRVVSTPTGVNTCGNSYLKQTCPEAHASAECPSDTLLTDQLDTFTVKYYDPKGNDVSKPEQASIAEVNIKLKDKAYAEEVVGGSSIKIRKSGS
ncbi:MAG: prepilin-type N-terminal cleavage/methylation domain-containing protein [bacterium]